MGLITCQLTHPARDQRTKFHILEGVGGSMCLEDKGEVSFGMNPEAGRPYKLTAVLLAGWFTSGVVQSWGGGRSARGCMEN